MYNDLAGYTLFGALLGLQKGGVRLVLPSVLVCTGIGYVALSSVSPYQLPMYARVLHEDVTTLLADVERVQRRQSERNPGIPPTVNFKLTI